MAQANQNSVGLSIEYPEMILASNRRDYLNQITHPDIDFSTLSVSNPNGAFYARIVQENGLTYLKVTTNDSLSCSDSEETAVMTIKGKDSQNTQYTQDVSVTQTIESADFVTNPYGTTSNPVSISWQGGTKTFTINNDAPSNCPAYTSYHIAEITKVYIKENGVDTDLPFTTQTVDGKIQLTVTFPRNTAYEDITHNLYITAKDNFTPSSTVSMNWPGVVKFDAVPEGSLSFNESERWVNSITWDGNADPEPSELYYRASNIDTSTLTYSLSGDSILSSVSITPYGIYCWRNNNATENQLTQTLTISGTDYGGTVRSASIDFKQYKASEGWYLHLVSYPATVAYNESIDVTFKAKNVSNFGVSDPSVTSFTYENTSDDNYSGTISLTPNTSSYSKPIIITLNGTVPANQRPVTSNMGSCTQLTKPGSITLDRTSIVVPANSDYDHLDVKVTTENINGTITTSISGDVSGTFDWYTYNNEKYLLFTPTNNTTSDSLNGVVTLSGTDGNGNTVTASYDVIQRPYNPVFAFTDFSTRFPNYDIPYNQNEITFAITYKAVTFTDVAPWMETNNSFRDYFKSGTLVALDSEHLSYKLETYNNNTHTTSASAVLTAENFETEFGKNPWVQSYWYPENEARGVFIKKLGIPGRISLSPETRTVNGSASSTTFEYSGDSYMNLPLTVSHSGNVNVTDFRYENGRITIAYGENTTQNERRETITVTGTDYQDTTITKTATLTQRVNSYLNLTPDQTINQDQTSVEFNISDLNVSNLQVSYSGSVGISNYSLTEVSGGHKLTLTTTPNDTRSLRTSTITVSATNFYGASISSSVILTQIGLDGAITIDPTNRTIQKTGSSFVIGVSSEGIDTSTLNATTSGDISFSGLQWNSNKNQLTVAYDTNEGATDLTGIVTVTGTDYKGNTITATCNITQVTVDSHLSIIPNQKIVDQETTATFTIDSEYVTIGNVSFSGASSYVKSYNLNGNILTLNLNQVTLAAEFIVYVTVSGYGLDGNEISDTATLKLWGIDGYFNVSPATGWVVGKNAGNVSYTVLSTGINSDSIKKETDKVWAYAYDRTISYTAYNGTPTTWDANRVCTLTVSGVDYKGNKITKTRTLTQYALNAEMTIAPTTADIEYNGYVDVNVTLVGPAPIPTIIVGEAAEGSTYTWLNEWGNGTTRTNTLRITPPANMRNLDRTLYYTFESEPLYVASTIWRDLTVNQAGKPASITLTPETITANKDAGSVVYNITVDGVELSSLSRTYSASWITSATFNSDKSQLTVVYSANPNVATREATISVYSDSLGSRLYGYGYLNQTGIDPVLSAYDLTIGYQQANATEFIETKGVDNLSVTFSGDVTITNYSFVRTTGGYNLVITTPDNPTNDNFRSVATVTGTVTEGQYEGETRSTSFNIIKYGIESISITPDSKTLDYGENTATFNVDSVNVSNIQVSISGDSSFITGYSLNNGILTVNTSDFSARTAKTATITVSGAGLTGTISKSATLTKYGLDGIITVTPSSLTFPKSAHTSTASVTTSGINGSLIVSNTGNISFSGISLNGSTLQVSVNNNTSDGDLSGVITLTGTDYKGKTITATVNVLQKPYDSLIQLDPVSRTVDKNNGHTTYTIITDNVDTTTIRASFSGQSINSLIVSGDTINVYYKTSSVVADINNVISVNATDIYGSTVSASATLVQTGIDPTISANNISIPYNQSNATAFVATNGVGNLSVSFSGDVEITNYTITPTTGGFNINLETADNTTTLPKLSTATVTGIVTEGQFAGQERTTSFTINKFGIEGVIVINPSTTTVRKNVTEVVFDVTFGNIDPSTVTSSIGTFNSDKTKLTVNIGANPNASDRTINVTITGVDYNDTTKTATATITQYGIDPYISISPASKTIGSNVANATFSVTAYKTSSLSVSFDGAVNVLDYSLDGSSLTITTAPNDDQFAKRLGITISGVDELGQSVSATATLVKAGYGNGILVNPSYYIPSNAGTLVIDYELEDIDADSIIAMFSGDIDVTSIKVDRENKKIIVQYNANSSANELDGELFLYGVDENGVTTVVTVDLTQLATGYSIEINPAVSSVSYSAGSTSATVTTSGIASTNFGYAGSMSVNSCTYANGTISTSYNENTSDSYKQLYLTVTGVSTTGNTVTSSAVIAQGINPTDGIYLFMLQPASQIIRSVEAGYSKVYYTITSLRGNDTVGYDVTGFILSGLWGTKPTVKYEGNTPYITIPLNTHSQERRAVVIFTQDGSLYTLSPTIVQEAGVEPDINPIWKDYSNSVSSESFIEYHITLDGDIIYSGKAYKFPDGEKVTWSINDAVSNYLGNGIRFTDGIHQIPDYSKDFYMETNLGNKYIETFYNSWAYKDTDYWLSDPIDYRVDPRQWLPVSFLSTNYNMITVNGRTYAALKENDGWTVMTRLNNYIVDCNNGISVIGEDGSRLTYNFGTGDYVLYYSNAYGGWDSLLCNGTSRKTDNIEHLNYRRRSNNQSDFSKINYQNTITPTWSLKTGLTVDGSKMYHLLESTMVYLHNLNTDEIIPVVITNSNCEYMNYTNNGKKPYYYTITVEESNQKLRK